MNKNVQISVGQPVSSKSDVKKFLDKMKKDYNIKTEANIVKVLQNAWAENPKENKHIVMFFNEQGESFISFIDDSQVLSQHESDDVVPMDLVTIK